MGPSLFIQLPTTNLLRRAGCSLRLALEIALFSALILATRCANYRDVLVDGKIYFVDADCYSRMTRVRMVAGHPGLIVRQHDFENFPAGISPHTTAPLDYLITLLALCLRPFTSQPLDLAGAIVSPLLALAAGWFLWWWSRRIDWPGRWALLLVYALSAMLVHGTTLGRPDQQSMLIVTLLVALAAEYRLQEKPSRGWGTVSGIAWGLALWVSLYEPLILLAALLLSFVVADRAQFTARARRPGWWVLLGIVLLAALIERRLPEWPGSEPFFANWAGTIGELKPVSLTDPIWLSWLGGLFLVSPILLLVAAWHRLLPWTFVGLFALCFVLTIAQARWGYFLVTVFLFTIPVQFALVRPGWRAGALLVAALFPLLFFWDESFRPNEATTASRAAERTALVQWRAVASSLAGPNVTPILAPWWLAPATAYWSGQAVVAGSSHESLPGIVASARFFLSTSPEEAWKILRQHRVKWVLAEDSERVAANSAAILGLHAPSTALCFELDRDPTQVPDYLKLIGRNGSCTLYEVRDLHDKFRTLRKPGVDMSPAAF
ncbi:MAG TPA: hypothetical protein VGL24_06500 [Chthoniobacterales bacterium]